MLTKKNYNLLRWICVFPGAIGIYLIVGIIFGAITNLQILFSNIEAESWTIKYIIPAIITGVSSAAFVWMGSLIAPNWRKRTALVLLILMILYSVITIFSLLYLKEYEVFAPVFGSIVGSLFGYIAAAEEEVQNQR